MSLVDEMKEKVAKTFKEQWEKREGLVIPEADALKLSNDAIELDGVVLYADMADSTVLVDTYKHHFAAEIYKSYLYCAAKLIRSEGGEITAYNGDRIMAVFVGDRKNTSAVKAALKINYARREIINPAIKAQYNTCDYQVSHTIGIDSCKLFVARTGVRGANDLVWVGRAANHAAKLCLLSHNYPTRITKDVYDKITDEVKIDSQGKNMRESVNWSDYNRPIFRSNYQWRIS
ncbi:MAG: adenylate/guanylate cyclase domain-containing protein [Chloroflexota bacterium]